MNQQAELARVIRSHRVYQAAIRLLRRGPDTTDKTRAFRRDVLNAIEADRFERVELAGVARFRDREALLQHCLELVPPERSVYVELGVGSAASTRLIMETARRLGRLPTLHGFDSFAGLPEAWGEVASAGTYAYPRPVLNDPAVELHEGWFADTLPGFVAGRSDPLGFVHVDCDLYSSTKTALTILAPLLVPGTVLLFDEYWNYLEAPEHEQRALREFSEENGLGFDYIGYNVDFMQAAVVLTASNDRKAN